MSLSSISPAGARPLFVCFSHLRWDFVFQRPQQLMTRFARDYRVIFWEEHIVSDAAPKLLIRELDCGVRVIVPHIPAGLDDQARDECLATLLVNAIDGEPVGVFWYYTPMMVPHTRHLAAEMVVYDCMDELANFRFAPPDLLSLERELLTVADVVFTGGQSLYEAKRDAHLRVYSFPSSVDIDHFGAARDLRKQRLDHRPKLGFYGVIDERMDLALLAELAEARPQWDIELVGPVAKIDTEELPQLPNLRYPGPVAYANLPHLIAGWDVALMPFAINDATRFISPTKTPEYLSGGLPVVSTAIVDVVRNYGSFEGVKIASTVQEFVAACEQALQLVPGASEWLAPIDEVLAQTSWDMTAARMAELMLSARSENAGADGPYDWLVVGAGFAGAVMAERLAADGGQRVLVVDRRPHVGGNAFDRLDDAGILIHQYGPHIFHTNSDDIVTYLSRFTEWRPYEHRVLAEVGDKQVPVPINRTTLNALYNADLQTDEDVEDFLSSRAEHIDPVKTSEDVVVGRVGRELYEMFFRGYTRKQWGLDPSELDKSVTARVPTRTNTDDRYFNDSFQAMPAAGYTAMFQKMLDHPNITVMLATEWEEVKDIIPFAKMVFTGPIDEYFSYRFGKLPYRSLRFEHQTLEMPRFQNVAVVNYPSEDVPWTRITEYKHLTGQVSAITSVTYEYPQSHGDPYYPVPRPENQVLFKRYEALASIEADTIFVGRLATYRYYNMDQVVGQALATYRRLKPDLEQSASALSVAAE